MLTTLSLSVAALIASAVVGIGCTYLLAPERISGSFGLKPPAPDANTRAWLRLKGVRDLGSGVLVLLLLLTADRRSFALALLALAIIPLGDMLVVLGSDGSKSKAFSIHGLTCAVMLAAGLCLLHVL